MAPRARFWRALGLTGWVLFTVALMILTVEGTGRAVIRFRYGRPGKSYGLWRSDPELGVDHRPNAYNTLTTTNDHGFRNRQDVLEPRPEGAPRIIAFGGSTTFGYNLRDEETFTWQLETLLRQEPGLEQSQVLNAGRIACSTAYNLKLVRRLVPDLRPDYAIVYEGVNEMLNAYQLTRQGVSLDDLEGTWGVTAPLDQERWLKRNSVIVRFVDYVVKRWLIRLGGRDPVDWLWRAMKVHPWVVANFRVVFGEMLTELETYHVRPVVVRYAFSKFGHIHGVFSDAAADLAREHGALVYDMRAQFENAETPIDRLFIHSGVHVTPEGARMMARGLAEGILEDWQRSGRGHGIGQEFGLDTQRRGPDIPSFWNGPAAAAL